MYSLPVKALNSPPIASISVEMSRERRAPLRALEEHVLGEVRDAVRLARLVARAGGEHDEARDRLGVRHRRGQDAEPVGQVVSLEGSRPSADGIEAAWRRRATRAAMFAQPEWLRGRFPPRAGSRSARLLFTGCGTSFHAAQTGGYAVQALEAVLAPPRGGRARLRLARGHDGAHAARPRRPSPASVARDRQGRQPARASLRRGRRLHAGDRGELVPHGELHVRRRRDRGAARRGHRRGSPTRSRRRSTAPSRSRSPTHERWLVAGAGRDWPTAQEAVLKLREGAIVAAEAHQTEQLLHGHLAAVDETVRALRARGGGPRRRARARRGRGARGARLRGDARPDAPPGRGHRPLPSAHPRPRGATAASTRTGSAATTRSTPRPPSLRPAPSLAEASSSRSRSGVEPDAVDQLGFGERAADGVGERPVGQTLCARPLDRCLLDAGVLGQRQPER